MRNELTLIFSLLVESPDLATRRTIADFLMRIVDETIDAANDRAANVLDQEASGPSPDPISPFSPATGKPKRRMSATARRNIRNGQRRRWKAVRAAKLAAKGKG